jgi:hypothetical protein
MDVQKRRNSVRTFGCASLDTTTVLKVIYKVYVASIAAAIQRENLNHPAVLSTQEADTLRTQGPVLTQDLIRTGLV